jgi:hypothetical protein
LLEHRVFTVLQDEQVEAEGKTAPTAHTARAWVGHSPVLTRLSLAESLPSVARLRFARQIHGAKGNAEVTEEDSRKIDPKDST